MHTGYGEFYLNTNIKQNKQIEWYEQWEMLRDNEISLFKNWIYPLKLEDLYGKDVLETGCGGGHHTSFMAPYAKKITAVDLNTISIAKDRNQSSSNIEFIEADIGTMNLGKQFDIVFSIGVVHHTDDPNKTVTNLIRHVKPGGRLVLWVYSKEGNFLVEYGVEPIRRFFLRWFPRKWIYRLSQAITAAMILPIYTIYYLPLNFLPYYNYFKNFRKLTFSRNVTNVFDKLNAPQVQFITKKRASDWISPQLFENIHLSSYCGVSWRVSGNIRLKKFC